MKWKRGKFGEGSSEEGLREGTGLRVFGGRKYCQGQKADSKNGAMWERKL